MKTQQVVITVVVTNIVSIAVVFLVITALRTDRTSAQNEMTIPSTETLPAPISPAAAEQPAVNKEQILALFDAGKEDRQIKAVEMFTKVMRDTPPHVGSATKGYPVVVAMKGDYPKAEQLAQEEIKNYPDIPESYYMLAWIYARSGNYDRALSVCNEAVQRGPAFKILRYISAWVYAKQGRYEDALKLCDEALRDDPSSPKLFYAKGRIQDVLGQNDQAVESYSRAISLKSDFAEAYLFRGLSYMTLGRYDNAIADQQQAIHYNAYDPAGYLALGLVYEIIGDYAAALKQIDNAITLGTYGAGDDAAKQPLTASIGIDDAVMYDRIGILNIRLGLYPEALFAFNQSIAIRPAFPDPYCGLTLTYVLQGDKESAVKSYEKLKRLDAELAKSVSAVVGQN